MELDVSEDSIRRDLRDLAAAGLCQRVYGGALPASPAVVDYSARQQVAMQSKRRVAVAAAALVELGVTGVHPDAALTTGDADEAAMKRAPAAPPTPTSSRARRRSRRVPVHGPAAHQPGGGHHRRTARR